MSAAAALHRKMYQVAPEHEWQTLGTQKKNRKPLWKIPSKPEHLCSRQKTTSCTDLRAQWLSSAAAPQERTSCFPAQTPSRKNTQSGNLSALVSSYLVTDSEYFRCCGSMLYCGRHTKAPHLSPAFSRTLPSPLPHSLFLWKSLELVRKFRV